MKRIINSIIVTALCVVAGTSILHAKTVCISYFKADTTLDPKKHPGTIDLEKHPEIMARVIERVKNGEIAYRPTGERSDTTLDLSKHPELVKAIIKNPANWPVILKAYTKNNDTLSVEGKNKQVIRDILAYLEKKHIIKGRSDVSDFLLTDKSFEVNGKTLSESLHAELKQKYIKAPDYVVYYGNSEKKGKGIFQRRDNL